MMTYNVVALAALTVFLLLCGSGDSFHLPGKYNRKLPTPLTSSVSSSSLSPREIVIDFVQRESQELLADDDTSPEFSRGILTKTILCVPPDLCSDDVVFTRKATNARIEGLDELKRACQRFELEFQSDRGVQSSIGRISAISNDIVRIQWNVTWVPLSAPWLEGVGKASGLALSYASYNHLSDRPSTFSWTAVGKLILNIMVQHKLRVPLACIEGATEYRFTAHRPPTNDKHDQPPETEPTMLISRITEDLSYEQDLQRGALRNRKCAEDLRVFLETGRRILPSENWYDSVAKSLPWQSVPGTNPLDVDPVEEGPTAVLVFMGIAMASVTGFALFLAPELIGQPLLGGPTPGYDFVRLSVEF